jgi:hypothetical protein
MTPLAASISDATIWSVTFDDTRSVDYDRNSFIIQATDDYFCHFLMGVSENENFFFSENVFLLCSVGIDKQYRLLATIHLLVLLRPDPGVGVGHPDGELLSALNQSLGLPPVALELAIPVALVAGELLRSFLDNLRPRGRCDGHG